MQGWKSSLALTHFEELPLKRKSPLKPQSTRCRATLRRATKMCSSADAQPSHYVVGSFIDFYPLAVDGSVASKHADCPTVRTVSIAESCRDSLHRHLLGKHGILGVDTPLCQLRRKSTVVKYQAEEKNTRVIS